MTLAVMGCIVNGPGESKAANIGISLPGTGEAPRCPVYIDGQRDVTLEGTYDELAAAFQALVDNYIAKKYPRKTRSEEHTSELQSRLHLVCRLLLEKKKLLSLRTPFRL